MKTKMTIQQKANNTIKNALNNMIKNISVVMIFVALGVVALLYLGPEIKLTLDLVFRLAVPSIIVGISVIMIYELWIKNGRRSAYEEDAYQNILNTYATKSDGLHYPTMQDFLDYEEKRRHQVEEDRLNRMLEREESLLSKLEQELEEKPKFTTKHRITWLKRRITKIVKAKDNIKITMPYSKSEEFDYLRYNLQDIVYREYSPNDTKKHLTKSRVSKYTFAITFTVIGFNMLSIGTMMRGNIWEAIIMTTLAAASLMYSVIGGFSTGYQNIKVVSTGVYNTANSFIDQAVAYCKKNNKDLYYKGPTEFKTYEPVQLDITSITEEEHEDIFTKAAEEVTKTKD